MAPNPTSSTLVPVKVDNDNLVEEKIDERILAILGIGDVFDLTYEEYISLLKEKSIEYRMSGADVPTESTELITEEFKRVKGKSGKFKVKSQKINFEKVVNVRTPSPQKAQLDPSKLLPLPKEEEKVEIEKEPSIKDILNFLKGDLLSGLSSILESLTQINQTLKEQNQIDRKSRESKRRTGELEKKSRRESELESKPTKNKEEEEKLKTPVVGFFDSIKKFLTNVLLGSVVLGLFKWLKDPNNEKAINGFGQFLTDNAPLILGGLLAIAALPIASTLLGLTGSVLGGIKILTGAIGSLGGLILKIPGLILKIPGLGAAAAAAAPVAGAIVASGVAAVGVALAMKGTYDLIRGQIAGGGDFAKVDEQLRNKLAGYGITETGMTYKKGSRKQQKLSESQQKVYEEIQGKRNELKKLKEERDTKIKEIELNPKYYTQKSPRSARVLSKEGEKKIQEIRESYNQKALKIFQPEQPAVQPQTSAVPSSSDYVSPFAGARDREVLNASKITGNAPITVGEKAGYSASRGRVHAGRDIAAPSGTGLQVSSDSIITDKGVDGGYGNYIVFKDSSGIEHLYGHMLEASPYKKGDRVSSGTVIGRVGSTGRSTGPHLHWEVSRKIGEVGRPRQNVIDPIEIGFPAQAPFTGKVELAEIAQKSVPTPSIPSPTGRSNITMLPLIAGAGPQQVSSGTSPNQAPVPNFSSEDPNNMTMLTVKAIYNMVG
jgi:murein DD-endopeptidase MepM/ murein hydrolase activator NlpD